MTLFGFLLMIGGILQFVWLQAGWFLWGGGSCLVLLGLFALFYWMPFSTRWGKWGWLTIHLLGFVLFFIAGGVMGAIFLAFQNPLTIPSPQEPRYPLVFDQPFTFSGHRGNVRYFIPEKPSNARPMRAMILLHGAGLTGRLKYKQTIEALRKSAVKYRTILVYPSSGQGGDMRARIWNDGENAKTAKQYHLPNHKAWLSALLGHLSKQMFIKKKQFFLVGHSNGGAMALAMADHIPNRLGGIAILGSVVPPSLLEVERRRPPLPLYILHGTKDAIVPYKGLQRGQISAAPIERALISWQKRNRCRAEPRVVNLSPLVSDDPTSIRRYHYLFCTRPLLYDKVIGGGHMPPGTKTSSTFRMFLALFGDGSISRQLSMGDALFAFFVETSK